MSRPLRRAVPPFGTAMASSIAVAASIIVGRLTWKAVAHVATTADITIATALNSGDTIDGLVLVDGMRVLVWQQTAQEENGIYVVDAAPFRAVDFDDSPEIVGSLVSIVTGSTYEGRIFRNTNTTDVVVDTDPITFEEQTAHVNNLDDIGDVDSGNPHDGDIIVYDSNTGKFTSVASGRHAHVVGEPIVGDGAQTVFYLANEAEADTVAIYNVNGARVAITQDATELDKITTGAALAAGEGWADYIPATT